MINKIGAITAFIFVVLLAMPITQQATHFNRCVTSEREFLAKEYPRWEEGQWHVRAVSYCNGGHV